MNEVKANPADVERRLNTSIARRLNDEMMRRRRTGRTGTMIRAALECRGDIVAANATEAERLRGLMPLGPDVRVVTPDGLQDLAHRTHKTLFIDNTTAEESYREMDALVREALDGWQADRAYFARREEELVAQAENLRFQVRTLVEQAEKAAVAEPVKAERPRLVVVPEEREVRKGASIRETGEPDWNVAMARRSEVADNGDVWEAFRCALFETVSERLEECDSYEEWRYCTPGEVVATVDAIVAVRARISEEADRG